MACHSATIQSPLLLRPAISSLLHIGEPCCCLRLSQAGRHLFFCCYCAEKTGCFGVKCSGKIRVIAGRRGRMVRTPRLWDADHAKWEDCGIVWSVKRVSPHQAGTSWTHVYLTCFRSLENLKTHIYSYSFMVSLRTLVLTGQDNIFKQSRLGMKQQIRHRIVNNNQILVPRWQLTSFAVELPRSQVRVCSSGVHKSEAEAPVWFVTSNDILIKLLHNFKTVHQNSC